MPADEVSTGSDVDAARVRTTGPRHAAPKKPLFTRLHMPAGKAIALAAMPTAVLMGMGFTPTLANAEDQPASKSLTIDEYKDCVAALEGADASASASPSPSASASASESADDSKDESGSDGSADDSKDTSGGSGGTGDSGSSDSGSDDTAEPAPAASSAAAEPEKSSASGDTATASPSDSETSKSVLETVGDAITDLFDGNGGDTTAGSSPSPSASASASAGDSSSDSGSGSSDTSGSSGTGSSGKDSSGTSKDSTDAVTDTAKDTVEDTADGAEDATKDTEEAADDATASPSPSESAGTDADDCPAATDEEGGIDNKIRLPDDPWYLNASSLLLKGADYQGIVKVKTANGTVKEVLKYVISDGTDIGDLHQTVDDKQSGKTYHVQAGKGTTSTIRDGDTIMYTESISGNLFGLIPITFTPKSPPPLNIPLIYFTNVKVQQAGQLGGTLTVPGLHQYTTG
ncbi:hypothetical protein [Streptomyces rishiriensis]|uniref:Membrane-bound hydrophilic protein n=1 Tax=Streptomyces rishiriensis TaxID=68264 RepID=A0ABU0NWN3_STRRH|nr:hypothetical protein [Streptomyces rishiriensis]MDQ0583548.1 hypothetical protein [Streptomyces rishiriensis]